MKITGAGHGIGRELAIGYASLGATVVCWDVNEETNVQTMHKIKEMEKSSVHAYRCDISDKNEVFKVAAKVKKEVRDITILINNAGIAPLLTLLNYDINEISRVVDVNLMAHYWANDENIPTKYDQKKSQSRCGNFIGDSVTFHPAWNDLLHYKSCNPSTCKKWFQRFKSGNLDLQDEECSGQPKIFEEILPSGKTLEELLE
ncbi:PREDICTED: short-chain dehydrogenase/reductase family 16C member 6-like [Dinoponera quadriceps]|uniref:Short-chain dehydrogenase/reductase family 16C member 6-like n=1 Tax=Dinoponera quadriceps TaxID=609295 RepID=A0A6P3Y3U2_DINQU|nr:PREDICTED: short-chain dehydrogenase/reductase family 16C member 6-like [Dinoponera quadriceps]